MSASSDMTPTDLDRKARELLAAEMDAAGSAVAAKMLRDGWPATGATVPALAAIEAALRLAVPDSSAFWREALRQHVHNSAILSGHPATAANAYADMAVREVEARIRATAPTLADEGES